jgi:hypothetical protein
MLEVTLYDYNNDNDPSFNANKPIIVDYVSQFNAGTHGPPALVAPGRDKGNSVPPTAREGDEVLYINTSIVPAYRITRLPDDE